MISATQQSFSLITGQCKIKFFLTFFTLRLPKKLQIFINTSLSFSSD